jgi:glycine betaine catabolism B
MNVYFDHSEEVAKNTRSFYFRPEKPAHYLAGQFIELYLPAPYPDERGEKHWFTLSSSPTEPLLAITTKLAEPSSTFKQSLLALKPGEKVSMAEPMGDFVLPKDPTIPVIFVAAGIGVTPMRSMIKYLKDSGESRDIHMLYAAHELEDFAFRSLFDNYGTHLDMLLKAPPADWRGLSGELNAKRIATVTQEHKNPLIYLSGPELLVETLFKDLQALGIKSRQLVVDYFPGYKQI